MCTIITTLLSTVVNRASDLPIIIAMPCPESACSTFFLFFTLLHCQQDDKWGKNTGCCLDCSAAVLWTTNHRYQPVAYVWAMKRKHWYIIILLLLACLVLTAVSRGTENIISNDSFSIMWLPISVCVLTNVLMETVTDWNKIWVIHHFLPFDHFEINAVSQELYRVWLIEGKYLKRE